MSHGRRGLGPEFVVVVDAVHGEPFELGRFQIMVLSRSPRRIDPIQRYALVTGVRTGFVKISMPSGWDPSADPTTTTPTTSTPTEDTHKSGST